MSEELIKLKIQELKQIKTQREEACGSLELQLQEIQEEIRQKSLGFEHQYERIEAEVKTLILGIGRTIKTEHGAVIFTKSSVRTSYDTKALDMLCASREDIKIAISPFRKETPVNPTPRVEVY